MRDLLIGLVFFMIAVFSIGAMIDLSHAAAPTLLTVDGSTSWEQSRIKRLESSLNFTKEPMPDTWNIHIVPGDEFKRNTETLRLDTESAYTYIPLDQTYLNEEYLTYADNTRVRHTLAHEAGHMICACNSEAKAEAIAYELER